MNLDLDWRVHVSESMQDVTCKIRPLKLWAFQAVMAFWQGLPTNEEGQPRLNTAASIGLIQVAEKVFPEHVKELQNITVQVEGKQRMATIDDLCKETAFMGLSVEIIGALITISEVGAEEEKNSGKPLGKSSEPDGSGNPAAGGSEGGPVQRG